MRQRQVVRPTGVQQRGDAAHVTASAVGQKSASQSKHCTSGGTGKLPRQHLGLGSHCTVTCTVTCSRMDSYGHVHSYGLVWTRMDMFSYAL